MNRIKILFLIHTLQIGGAEKVLVDLVNNMDQDKFDITVMTVVDTGAFKKALNKNIKYKTIISLPKRGNDKAGNKASGNLLSGKSKVKGMVAGLYQSFWRHVNLDKVYRKYIREKYDVEVAFLEGVATKIIAHSNNPDSKKVAWVHIDLLKEKKSEMFYRNVEEEKKTYSKFDQVVAVSGLVRDSFIKKYGYDERKVIVKYNPIDVDNIKDKAGEMVEKKRFTICSVGRLSKQKGYLRLLEAVSALKREGIVFDVWIIGVGAEEGVLNGYIQANKLEDNVKLLGYKENPYPYIKSADLYVCSSITEGMSTTVSEAIVLGTPVVATDCSGMKELLGDSEYGMVCENSEKGIEKAIRDVILDKKLYNDYKKKIKGRANFLDLKRSVEEISDLFI